MRHHYSKRLFHLRGRNPRPPTLKRGQVRDEIVVPETRKTKVEWYPSDVQSEKEKGFYEKFKLHPAGGWTEDMVGGNRTLVLKHWERVKEFIKKHPPPVKASKKVMEEWYKKAIMTPEHEVVMWSEASLRGPLSHESFLKYMEAFEKVVGKEQFEALFGDRSPKELTKDAEKQEKVLIKNKLIPEYDAAVMPSEEERIRARLRKRMKNPYDLVNEPTDQEIKQLLSIHERKKHSRAE